MADAEPSGLTRRDFLGRTARAAAALAVPPSTISALDRASLLASELDKNAPWSMFAGNFPPDYYRDLIRLGIVRPGFSYGRVDKLRMGGIPDDRCGLINADGSLTANLRHLSDLEFAVRRTTVDAGDLQAAVDNKVTVNYESTVFHRDLPVDLTEVNFDIRLPGATFTEQPQNNNLIIGSTGAVWAVPDYKRLQKMCDAMNVSPTETADIIARMREMKLEWDMFEFWFGNTDLKNIPQDFLPLNPKLMLSVMAGYKITDASRKFRDFLGYYFQPLQIQNSKALTDDIRSTTFSGKLLNPREDGTPATLFDWIHARYVPGDSEYDSSRGLLVAQDQFYINGIRVPVGAYDENKQKLDIANPAYMAVSGVRTSQGDIKLPKTIIFDYATGKDEVTGEKDSMGLKNLSAKTD